MVVKRRRWQIIMIIRRRRDLLFLVRCVFVCVCARAFNYARWDDDISTYLLLADVWKTSVFRVPKAHKTTLNKRLERITAPPNARPRRI
jgi:hypothetical protein